MGDYYDEDGYDYERRYRGRRPSPRRNISDVRRSTHFLDPNMMDGGGLYRTRSQGHAPVPVINTYVDVVQDNNQRAASPYPPYVPYPASPGYRRRDDRLGDDLVDAIEDLALETRRAGRSRSRGRSDFGVDRREDYYDWERRRRSEERRIKEEVELERIKTEEDEKAKKQRIIDDYERKRREDSEDRKAEEKRMREKIKQEEIDKKEKDEREYQEFLDKQRKLKEEEEEKKRKKEEEIDEALRERFYNMGWTKARVDMEIEREKIRRKTTTTIATTTMTSSGALVPLYPANQAPTYAKVKREHVAIETLKYYGIPWEYDRKDKKYIIILREMSESETDALFEHTRQLNEKKLPLLLEPSKDPRPQYAFYRKRDRSSSRVRKAGILKYED